ncbi:MAG: hypothetical protein CL843_01125 [Crocinitomicaceae bacterium]|nr:hypothetical protein [Crocinitomicaceae bacterium]
MPGKYFNAYEDFFWEYTDNDTVISLGNGYTIVYVAELRQIITRMSHQGLPPLSALLLVLACINEKASSNLNWIRTYSKKGDYNLLYDERALDFLSTISSIDPIYKTGNGKQLLLNFIFNNCHGHLPLNRSVLIGEMCANKSYLLKTEQQPFDINVLQKAARVLSLLSAKYPSVKELEAQLSGLPSLDESLEIEVLDKDDFVNQLIEKPDTRKIGLLVNRISSGLHIPFNASDSSDQKIGGVSSITNKGNFDQLLLSEYANDDLTFLLRLANNEALFLSKESPPASSKKRRVLLIDVSILSWGVPKTVSFATLIGIAKHPKNNLETIAYTLGEEVSPVHLDTVKDLTNSLIHVDVNLSCANGLDTYFAEHHQSNDDVYYLGEKQSLLQPQMQVSLAEHTHKIKYWILNDDVGNIDVYKNLKKSKKHVQHMELPLKALWSQKIQLSPAREHNKNTSFYPILVTLPQNKFSIRSTSNGEIYMFTHERSLLRLHNKFSKYNEVGWEIVMENLPGNYKAFEIGKTTNGEIYFLSYVLQTRKVFIIKLSDRSQKVFSLPVIRGHNNYLWMFLNNKFYYQTPKGTYEVNPDTGITITDAMTRENFLSREKIVNELRPKSFGYGSTIKNLKAVGISNKGELVINSHKFVLNSRNHFKFNALGKDEVVLNAQRISENRFEFNNGVAVTINRNGFIRLSYPHDEFQDLFIPSTIDVSLGISTQKAFAGNQFYLNQLQVDIFIQNISTNKLGAIKAIKEITTYGLAEIKKMVDQNISFSLNCFMNIDESKKALGLLHSVGVTAEVQLKNNRNEELIIMSTIDFYELHVKPFCKAIE